MRDTQKMKDKLELQLEGRHLFTLSLVFCLALGAVFWLGIGVGKKLQREDTAPPQPDLLAALDAQKGPAPAPLTFQEELTRKQPVVAAEKPVVKPVEKPAEKPAEKPVEKVAEAPVPQQTLQQAMQKVAEKPIEPAPPPKEGDKYIDAMAQPRTAELNPEPKVDLKPATVAEKPAPRPTPVVEKPLPAAAPTLATTRAPDAGGALKEAMARASRPAQTSADGQWTLQLSAYQDRSEADRYLGGLRDRGYAPYVVEAKVPNKGTWFRVRMGRFATREAAARYQADFQRETQIPAIVTGVQ